MQSLLGPRGLFAIDWQEKEFFRRPIFRADSRVTKEFSREPLQNYVAVASLLFTLPAIISIEVRIGSRVPFDRPPDLDIRKYDSFLTGPTFQKLFRRGSQRRSRSCPFCSCLNCLLYLFCFSSRSFLLSLSLPSTQDPRSFAFHGQASLRTVLMNRGSRFLD